MSTAGEEALRQARLMMASALAPNSTSEARRKFHQHLITLPSYPSYDSKAFFGTLVAKFFGEFESLQDDAIDALLDLCEDEEERVRIVGIKGLGPTGRADPRWVRGNTGVLLQLLASQPKELKYVRESLHTLLAVSPFDVFSVIVDDCRAQSEDETGVSRRNIIEFLYHDARDDRRGYCESGKYPQVEDVFREGFLEVLSMTKGIGREEKEKIIKMLIPLPSVSGDKATEGTREVFCRSLIKLISTKSSPEETQPIIGLFKEFLDRSTTANDPRIPLLLFATHGTAVTKLGMEKNEPTAKKLITDLSGYAEGALKIWGRGERGDTLSEEILTPQVIESVLPPVIDACDNYVRTGNFANAGQLIELVLYAVYRLATHRDRRRDIVRSSDAKRLLDLTREATKVERRLAKGSSELETWRNIVDMLEILGDYKFRVEKITPSWEAPSTSTRKQVAPSGRTATPPTAPRGPKKDTQVFAPPSGPRGSASRSAGPVSLGPATRAPSGPRRSDNVSQGLSGAPNGSDKQPKTTTPVTAAMAPLAKSPQEPANATRPRTPPLRPPTVLSHSPVRIDRSPSTSPRPPTPPLPPTGHSEPVATKASNGSFVRKTTTSINDDAPVSSTSNPLSRPAPGRLSIRNAAQTTSTPSAPVTEAETEPAPAPVQTQTPIQAREPVKRVPSLADRLGVAASTPSPTSKRSRDREELLPAVTNGSNAESTSGRVQAINESQIANGAKPSLLSRLASRDGGDIPQAKRVKDEPRLSLRDRINGAGSSTHSPASTTPLPTSSIAETKSGLSILNRSSQQQQPTFSILNRAKSIVPPPTSASEPAKNGISILNRSSSSNISHETKAEGNFTGGKPQKEEEKEEVVVVRKGRGFRERTPDGVDIVMADTMSDIPPPQQARGQGLAGRLSGGSSSGFGIRGRGGSSGRGLVRLVGVRGGRGR
ncbi:hypothetical protein IAR55_003285 [Kwoniella newhampshirensis]|uniref:Uncharacterized protein n=1 Tax=Kwoniella newhampshirensis TaxID=1651941 RepID=A0AAW0YQI0_9TREE